MNGKTLKYLERIGLNQAPKLTLDGLKSLQKAHLLEVPFENLDIHLGVPIVLNLDSIYDKVVNKRRGGFCYELNGLFFELLSEIGFDCRMIAAEVFHSEKGYGPAFDHMALLVKLDGQDYLVDVGFGEFAFAPLRIDTEKAQEDARGTFRIEPTDGGRYLVKQWKEKQWQTCNRFSVQACTLKEFTTICNYHQTSPDSHFTQKRLISRPINNGRISIAGDKVKIRVGSETHTQFLADAAAFSEILNEYFHITLDSPTFKPNA